MFKFLFQLSDGYIFLLLSVISIVISMVAIFIVSRHIPMEFRYKDNAAISNTSALIGIIYGVLAGLIALYLLNANSATEVAVQREASAVADIFRDSKWLPDPARTNLRIETKQYLDHVINVEWPLMKEGAYLPDTGRNLVNQMDKEIFLHQQNANPTTNTLEFLILHHLLEEIQTLYDAREQRLNINDSVLSPSIWVVILIGTVLIIGINFLFGMNFYLHLISIAAIALMTSSIIFLLLTLDRPFQGEFAVEPKAYQSALHYINLYEKQLTNVPTIK